jgi:hypothetical protein
VGPVTSAARARGPGARIRGPAARIRGPAAPPAASPRAGDRRPGRDALVAAATEPFNVAVLAGLLVAGAVLGTVALMVPLALLVYAAGVALSLRSGARDG